MLIRNYILLIILVLPVIAFSAYPVNPVPRTDYLEFARASADWTWEHQDSLLAQWRKTFDAKSIFGYRSPPGLLEMATIYAIL